MLNSFVFFANSRPITWYWEQCDTAAQVIVGILIVFSVWSISTIIKKSFDLRTMRKDNLAFETRLQHVLENAKMSEIGAPVAGTTAAAPYVQLLDAALRALRNHGGEIEDQDDVKTCVGQIENSIQRALARVSSRYESRLVLLSTFVSAGPFLGLLGTVWGVMITFGALTEKASIAQLAPGVSGALVATTAGLLLAIPAVLAYNYLLGKVRRMSVELENFASMIADDLELELKEKLSERRKKGVPAAKSALERNGDAENAPGVPAAAFVDEKSAPTAPGTRAPWA